MKEYGHMFYTRKDWSKFLADRKVSFSIGSRFHGNMMAFSNGIFALGISHDVRTNELIEAMKLPYITYQELLQNSMDEIKDMCTYGLAFYNNYYNMGEKYIEFLNQCNIKHNFN